MGAFEFLPFVFSGIALRKMVILRTHAWEPSVVITRPWRMPQNAQSTRVLIFTRRAEIQNNTKS